MLTITRSKFEALFGSLSDLIAHHAAWKVWANQQKELVGRSAILGPRYADIMEVSF